MTAHRIRTTALAAAVTLAAAAPALAENASQLLTLNGLEAPGAESALVSRGFKHISSHRNSLGYTYSYWWHGGDRNCIQVEAYGGRVETIQDAQGSDCNQAGSSDGAKAAGVLVGAAILGAIIAHKSHHKEDKRYDDGETEAFERGYKDGLHNASYHNYDRSDAYSHGYQQGVDERAANLRHHHNRGGYVASATFADLQGARAAGATEELGRRGFRQVDNFVSGNTRYGIWWRGQSQQCLQATIADGRIYDLRDIQQHPKCR